MERRKVKKHTFLLKLGQEDYEKLITLAGESYTYTDVIISSIRANFATRKKNKELPEDKIKNISPEEQEKIDIAGIDIWGSDTQ